MLSPCKEKFLEITRTPSHSFCDISGKSSYSCNNHNALLNMMEGALSGKTGFTGKAGYCYVGAVQREEKTYIVALLACGWPNNKTYKWKDTQKLIKYGLDNYEYREVFEKKDDFLPIAVPKSCMVEEGKIKFWENAVIRPYMKDDSLTVLLNSKEQVRVIYTIRKNIQPPIKKNDIIGTAEYYLNNQKIKTYNIYSKNEIIEIKFKLCVMQVIKKMVL